MGAESSVFDDCTIDKEYFQVNDWNLHNGIWKNHRNLSGFASSGFRLISVFCRSNCHRLSKRVVDIHENFGKNLKLFRHPGIVRYITSGHKGDDIFVITERITPLSKLLKTFSSPEICAGLFSVLQAMEFCHDMCNVRHSNFGVDCVFVTDDGTWKIAGMEFLCHLVEYNEAFLQKSRAFRNDNLIPPEEKEGQFSHLKNHSHAGDVYAIGILLRDVLEYNLKMEDTLYAKEFLDNIKKVVLTADPTLRPTVKQLLENDYFKNDFLDIMTFLKNITVKSDSEKDNFFRTLTKRLMKLPETLVATRLTTLLLARFVLLDSAAGQFFLSDFFTPCTSGVRNEDYIEGSRNPILCLPLYKAHVIPNLVSIFEVLDFDIRMILLRYFTLFVDLFDHDVLKNEILPQILLGVKDTNNELVVSSLQALASVVPVLGGDVVIGKHRQQYFTEAKPKGLTIETSIPQGTNNNSQLLDVLEVLDTTKTSQILNKSENLVNMQFSCDCIEEPINEQMKSQPKDEINCSDGSSHSETPPDIERSSPDGGEGSDNEIRTTEDYEWSDWEGLPNERELPSPCMTTCVDKLPTVNSNNTANSDADGLRDHQQGSTSRGLGEEFDIVAVPLACKSEVDFFADMQPVLSKSCVLNVDDKDIELKKHGYHQRLTYNTTEEDTVADSGWGDDLAWTEDL